MPPVPPIHCASCGYDFAGLPTGPCRECGSTERAVPGKPAPLSRRLSRLVAAAITIAILIPLVCIVVWNFYFAAI